MELTWKIFFKPYKLRQPKIWLRLRMKERIIKRNKNSLGSLKELKNNN
jgi:hypothetical protein